MRITVLIDNTANEADAGLASEWGLSLHLAFGGKHILFDCGASDAFSRNAARLGLSLAAADAAVLSHHHYDHGGGVAHFFDINSEAPLYLAEPPDGACYSQKEDLSWKYVGLDAAQLEANRARLRFITGKTAIFPGVYLLPAASRQYPAPAGNSSLYLNRQGRFVLDPFAHELCMVAEDAGGLAVFTGCAHCGLQNLLDTVNWNFPAIPIKALIGGLHLMADQSSGRMLEQEDEVRVLAQAVLNYPVAMIHTVHCTCAPAYSLLRSILGGKIAPLYSGAVIEV